MTSLTLPLWLAPWHGFILSGELAFGLSFPAGAQVRYPAVTLGDALSFPRDHGAHPEFRGEWWYATGWLQTGAGDVLGFQVTFFRTRPEIVTCLSIVTGVYWSIERWPDTLMRHAA